MIQSQNIKYENNAQLKAFLEALKVGHPEHALVQIFSGILDRAVIEGVLQVIAEVLPETPVIGATTAGEIMDGQSLDQSMVINVTQFEETVVKSKLVAQNEDLTQAGVELVSSLKTDQTKALILLGCGIKEGHTINATELMSTLQREMPGIPISGAQAGDNGRSEQTFVFTEAGITDSGFAAAALNSDILDVVRTYNLSWIPIGKKMTITKAEGSRVYTIDHMPPLEVYKYYLGEDVAENLPLSAADFPLMIERDGMRQAIHATGVNTDGSFNFIHDFRVGEQIRFGYCHVGLLAKGANRTYELLSANDLQVAFVYTCVSRKWVLGEDIEVELSPIAELNCSAGFYSYGEYYQLEDGANLFLGQTMTLLGLSENTNWKIMTPVKDRYHTKESRQFKNMRVLHRLIEKSTVEIEKINGELADLVLVDTLTGLGNRRRFDQRLKSAIKHAVSDQTMGLLLFDLDNFKAYNDTYGHVAGDDCLRGIGQVILDVLEGTDAIGTRYGGEEFAVILQQTDEVSLKALAETIRQGIQGLQIRHSGSETGILTASFGALLIQLDQLISEDQLIGDVDTLLYQAKTRGKNRIAYNSKTYKEA